MVSERVSRLYWVLLLKICTSDLGQLHVSVYSQPMVGKVLDSPVEAAYLSELSLHWECL